MATPSEYNAIVEQIYTAMQEKGYNGTMADLALALSTLSDDNPATTKWIDLGASSAYAIYVEHGGTMSEAEWIEYLSSVSEKSAQAHADAQSAKESAEAAEQAKTDVTEEAEQVITNIQTEGQTQITAVTNKGTEQVGAVNTAGTTQVNAVNTAGTTQVTAVNTAGSTQVTAVQAQGTTSKDAVTAEGEKQVERVSNQGTAEVQAVSGEGTRQTGLVTTEGNTQVARVTAEGTTQVGNVADAGAEQVTAVQNKGQEVIDSIPQDYTELSDNVDDLKSAINGGTYTFTKTYMSDNRYSTNRVYNAEKSNIGKKFSDIYSAQTTNAFAYMLDVTLSKLVKLPVGTITTTSSYGCLAFDENDICVWARQNTAGDVAGETVDVVLPENAVKMLCVFSNSLNSSGIEYVLTLQRNNALNKLGENIVQTNVQMNEMQSKIGDIHRKSFSVNANSTHSSNDDRMSVAISANTPFILGFDVTSANNTALAMLYAVKEDDTTANFKNIYPAQTVNKLYTLTLDYSVKAIGVYYSNTVNEAVTVSTLVAIGQIDTDAIYDNQQDVLFVEELNAEMPRTVFAKYADTTNAETFVFFSDPHYLLNNGEMTTERINRLDCEWLRQLKTKADAINAQAIICGGDLINAEQTDAELCYKLGMHHAIVRKLFGEKYHLALGNHDTRFDVTSQSVLDNLLFAEEDTQKAYFTVKTPKTKYYFLNTGTDQSGAMTEYRWTQIAWLAEHLQTDLESNRAIAMHIFSNDASGNPENFGNGITPMATNVVSLINAYNSKGTVTLNGTTYNFATAIGKIRFLLCGHTHYDAVYYATGNIPVICIDDATVIGNGTKLIMYSCLADYENGKLYAYRDGTEAVTVTLA